MPTNRRKLLRGRVIYTLTLADLTIPEMICLMRGWHPGISVATRWRTWEQFLDDADAVRGELLTDATIRRIYGDLEPFADRLRRDLGPGQVYDSHNHPRSLHPALWHAHVHYLDDNHRHGDDDDPDDVQVPGGDREPALV